MYCKLSFFLFENCCSASVSLLKSLRVANSEQSAKIIFAQCENAWNYLWVRTWRRTIEDEIRNIGRS